MPVEDESHPLRDDAKISLVIATRGRRDPLGKCLDSLTRQTVAPREVVVVDQNPPGWLDPILAPFRDRLPLVHVTSAPGAARARNRGVEASTGAWLGFPDDDCWYPPALVASLHDWTAQHPAAAFVTCRILDGDGQPIILRWPETATPLTRDNVWRTCSLAALFVRRAEFQRVQGFDVDLGVGAASGMESAEEVDLVLRLLADGQTGQFLPELQVYHPADAPRGAPGQAERALRYGRGIGRVLAKHPLPWSTRLRFFARPFAGSLLALARGDSALARYHRAALRGRLQGWRNSLPPSA